MAKKRKPRTSDTSRLLEWLPDAFLSLMSQYFRLEVDGIENIPKTGPAILTPNHSGFTGLDALILSHQVSKLRNRRPLTLTHPFWFNARWTAKIASHIGLVKASREAGRKVLNQQQLLVVFPEAEVGNFKPSTRAYELQTFRRGFVHLALECQCPVVPTLIVGAEDSHINLRNLQLPEKIEGVRLPKVLRNLVLPVPLHPLPLPARWKIRFLPPVRWPLSPRSSDRLDLVNDLVQDVREHMQKELNKMVQSRRSIYF